MTEAASDLATLLSSNRGCRACALRKGCSQVVTGEGPARARLLLIGEAPGGEEDRLGRPFVGPAGALLDKILVAAGLQRHESYLTNIVKCRPPANRDPTPEEAELCTQLWLRQELAVLRPQVVLTLGNVSTGQLLQTRQGITKLRGQWVRLTLPTGEETWLMPLLHPAYLLRQDTRAAGGPKSLTWRDIQEVAAVLRGEKEPQETGLGTEEQPGLFDGLFG